jgi:branched-chain amino acid transport system ATP-binding protein
VNDRSGAALEVDELQVNYGRVRALTNVSFGVPAGGTLAVLGPNGAGKSSLARAMSGLIEPSGGRILCDGEEISGKSPQRIRRVGITHLPEGRGIFRSLSVEDNLRMAVRWLDKRSEKRAGIQRALDMFPILSERRAQRAGSLSGGEQQMLSLARGLSVWPRVLIADELSLGLAPKVVDAVFDQLEQAREAGVTMIIIEQFVERALAFAESVVVLAQGQVAWSGSSDGVSQRDVMSWYLGGSKDAGSLNSN